MSAFPRVALGAAAFAALCLAGVPAGAKNVTLKMGNWVPPVHHMTITLGKWVKSVSAASGGTLAIKVDKSPLAKPPGQYDLVRNGVRDLTWGVAGYTPGRMELLRGVEVPFLTLSSASGSPALYSWYTRNGLDKREFNDTKLVTAFVHGPGQLHSKNPIRTLEDLKGVKIRVGGGGVPIAKSLGAVAVAMSATKAHESLQRGTTTAAFFPWEAVRGFRLTKLVSHHLEIPGGLYTTAFWINLNQKSWDKLSGAHKKALMAAGGVAGAKLIAQGWDDGDKVSKAQAIKNGNKVATIAPAELRRWAAKIQFVTDNWIERANAKGLDGKKLLAELRAMMAKPTH